MFAYSYPLLGVFWSMMFLFFWVAWIVLLFKVIVDIFRSENLGGFAKALWLLFVVIVPWLGVLVYLLVMRWANAALPRRRPHRMQPMPTSARQLVRPPVAAPLTS